MSGPTLGNPQKTIEVLQKYDFTFQKKFGQNFLIDTHVLDKIISAAHITKEDMVLEIGPGIGTMTQYLAEAAGKVIAVEIDKNLIPILSDTLSEYQNVRIINEDVLKLDLRKLADEENGGKAIKVVANLPYYITTPIIMGLFENHVPVESITVMVQKEAAERLTAKIPSRNVGAISYTVNYYSNPEYLFNVSRGCFMPPPNVDSAVIRFNLLKEAPVKVKSEKNFFKLIKGAFIHRRKTLVNSVSSETGIGKDKIVAALSSLNLSPTVRAEALSLEDFANLSNILF